MAGRPRSRAKEQELRLESLREGIARGLSADKRAEMHEEKVEATKARVTFTPTEGVSIEGGKRSREEIRDEALEKMYPMAEQIIQAALRGDEVNREQLNAAFRIFEQQLGKPTQTTDKGDTNAPVAVVYESAAYAPTEWLEQQQRLARLALGGAKVGDVPKLND